jgi:hypothetical protein
MNLAHRGAFCISWFQRIPSVYRALVLFEGRIESNTAEECLWGRSTVNGDVEIRMLANNVTPLSVME